MPRLTLNLDDVRQLTSTYTQEIPEDYLDLMGHMNVMWYTHLFALGTRGIMNEIGMTLDSFAERHGGTFILESHIRYLSEVRVGQTVDIYPRLIGRSEKRYHLMMFMTNRDRQDVSAVFESISSYIDLRQRRTAAFPDDISTGLDRLLARHEALSWEAPLCGVMKA